MSGWQIWRDDSEGATRLEVTLHDTDQARVRLDHIDSALMSEGVEHVEDILLKLEVLFRRMREQGVWPKQ